MLLVENPSAPKRLVATEVQIEPGATFVEVSSRLEVFVLPSQMKVRFVPVLTTLPDTMAGCCGGGGGGGRRYVNALRLVAANPLEF